MAKVVDARGVVIWSDKLGTGSSCGVAGVPEGAGVNLTQFNHCSGSGNTSNTNDEAPPTNVRRVGSFTPDQIWEDEKE